MEPKCYIYLGFASKCLIVKGRMDSQVRSWRFSLHRGGWPV